MRCTTAIMNQHSCTPKLLNGLISSPKVKIVEGEKVEACFVTHNTLRVEGHVRALG
jgi:hypothetical protein